MPQIRVQGIGDVQRQLEIIERGTRSMGRYRAFVRSPLPYAWGAEFGRHRVSGKLARSAGGSYYLTRAINEVATSGDADISEGLNKVKAPGVWVLRRLGLWTRRLARKNAPKKARGTKKSHNYRLYRSINYVVRRQ